MLLFVCPTAAHDQRLECLGKDEKIQVVSVSALLLQLYTYLKVVLLIRASRMTRDGKNQEVIVKNLLLYIGYFEAISFQKIKHHFSIENIITPYNKGFETNEDYVEAS